ncbi:MAG TPA: insulinase family protein [Rectinemataceae bacterium]|nr:insulinase family protein [Rectinemataceae bacterium]
MAIISAAWIVLLPLSDQLFAQTPAPTASVLPASGPAAISASTLGNGMDLILLPLPESVSVSLGIVFKGGAEAQTKKTAGLFRLLEKVLFRGTAASPGEPEPAGAMDSLGATSIEGGALSDRFGLSFLLAPEMLGQGLDTIAYLFSGLRLETAFSDPLTLEQARSSSLTDIAQALSDPKAIFEAAMAKKLFSAAPWRFDILGTDAIINAADENTLKEIAGTWLVPNNAALIIAGNFSIETVLPMIEKSFSSWKKAADPWKSPMPAFPKPGVTRPTLMVYADASLPPGEALIEMRYRGPDAGSGKSASAELWAEMASQPGSRLAQAITKGMPKGSSPSAITARYQLSSCGSWFSVSARILLDAKVNAAENVFSFKEIVRGSEMYAMKTSSGYFTPKEYARAKEALVEKRNDMFADPQEAASAIADGWVLGGSAWIQAWSDRIAGMTSKDITAFADEYFMKNLEVVSIHLEPGDYAARKKGFDAYGFEIITPQKAFWWK